MLYWRVGGVLVLVHRHFKQDKINALTTWCGTITHSAPEILQAQGNIFLLCMFICLCCLIRLLFSVYRMVLFTVVVVVDGTGVVVAAVVVVVVVIRLQCRMCACECMCMCVSLSLLHHLFRAL